jgi:hypothetical protein
MKPSVSQCVVRKSETMIANNKRLLDSYIYVFLLPLFFVLHGTARHFEFIPPGKAAILLLFYLLITSLVLLLFRLIFRSLSKAALSTFISLYFYFYFGAVHDSLKEVYPGTFLVRYSFILTVYFLVYISLLFLVKKIKPGRTFVNYLNLLFLFLVVFDTGVIFYKAISAKPQREVLLAKTGIAKPDVYLIVLDGYSGKEQLSKVFSYDNTPFMDSLRSMGFYVLDRSSSNYASTPFSMASLLNMDYLDLEKNVYNEENLNYCYGLIYNNHVFKTFRANGYKVFNYSFFNIRDNPAIGKSALLVSGIHLINSETLWARIKKDLVNNFIRSNLKGTPLYRSLVYENKTNNELFSRKALKLAESVSDQPRFSYTHLQLPHAPYFFDSSGKLNDEKYLMASNLNHKDLFLGYLKYANHFVIDFSSKIIKNSHTPPVIMILSDHGFRYAGPVNLHTSNIAAIYLPGKNYNGYYDSISNVNQFRVLFRTIFDTELNNLPDSSVMLDNNKEGTVEN